MRSVIGGRIVKVDVRVAPPSPTAMDSVLAQLQAELSGRYSLEGEVGRGGMAVVYLAQDVRHGRRVAIKVLHQGAGDSVAADRFLREIRTVAQLNHPHILPLHDSGIAGGYLFYVMPFVEGESLRHRMANGPLPLDEVAKITREVADALSFAHERGIVHRDIKPENILLSAGHAAVADFGIARAISAAGFAIPDETEPVDALGMTMTQTGVALGTPLYMSPEQATADASLDGRTDQYALACVAHEMLAGEPPFTASNALALLARHALDPAPPLSAIRPGLPRELDSIIARGLSKAAADRWPTVRDFAMEIERCAKAAEQATQGRRSRWAPALAVGATALAAAAIWQFGPAARGTPLDTTPLVGVLPFLFTGDSAFSYLAEGLSEGVTSGLVRVPGIRTMASGRAAQYRGAAVDPQRAGRELGLSMVVTAHVHVANDRVRVSPQIVRISDGSLVWGGEHLDGVVRARGQIAELFAIQDSMNQKIVAALLPRLTAAQRSAASRGARTGNAEAWRKYLQARRLTNMGDAASVAGAKALLDEALVLDSTFSDAWTALAQALDNVAHFSSRPPEDFKVEMRRALNRAVQYDANSGYALAQRGIYKVLNDWDWEQGIADINRATELEPGSLDVEWTRAGLLMWLGSADSALALVRRYHDSTNVAWWGMLTWAFASVDRWDSMLVAARRANAIDSSYVWNDMWLAFAALESGLVAEADRAAARFVRRSANQADAIGNIAVYFQRRGDLRGARHMRVRLDSLRRTTTWSVHSAEAMVRVALGDREGALAQMDSAVNAREYLVPVMLISLDPIRDHPRFRSAKQRVWGNRKLPRMFPAGTSRSVGGRS